MRLLVLGGTHFVGRHVVATALARGHDVTLFNRGLSDPGAFPEAEHLIGDRGTDLAPLRGREWDAVVDPSGFAPALVRATVERLAASAAQYVFISTAAVYDVRDPRLPIEESSAVVESVRPDGDLRQTDVYGPQKAQCEQVVRDAFPGAALVLRPGLIGGPGDLTDRFTYWPRRMAGGGTALAPGPPERPIQILDVRDLATWCLEMIEGARAGTFNVAGPRRRLADVLQACRDVAGVDTAITWADEAFLLEHGVKPWTEVPLWLPAPAGLRVAELSVARAFRAGLEPRDLSATIADVLAWDRERPRPLPRGPVGARYVVETLEPARERELLALWASRG